MSLLFSRIDFRREHQLIAFVSIGFAPAGASYLFCSCKKGNRKNTSRALVLRIPSAIFTANGSS